MSRHFTWAGAVPTAFSAQRVSAYFTAMERAAKLTPLQPASVYDVDGYVIAIGHYREGVGTLHSDGTIIWIDWLLHKAVDASALLAETHLLGLHNPTIYQDDLGAHQ